MRRLVYLILAGVLFFGCVDLYGQMSRRNIKRNNKRISSFRGRKSWFSKEKRYNAIGINVSALNYYGDLAPRPNRFSSDISFTRPALGLSFTHRFGPRYSLTGMFQYGTLKASDASAHRSDLSNGTYRADRNLSFRNRIKELSVVATFDLFDNNSTYISRVKWTPYAFIGLSLFTNNPKGQVPDVDINGNPMPNAGKWVELQPLGTEGQGHWTEADTAAVNYGLKKYHRIQPAIPFGIGVRYRFNEVIDFAFEIGFRYTFTDYIDDVSRNYVDLGIFKDNNLARTMSYKSYLVPQESWTNGPQTYTGHDGKVYTVEQGYGSESPDNIRGNKKDRDIFMVTTIKATYIIGKTFHRAKFR